MVAGPMTPKQERSFARYVSDIARVLTPGWDITLHFDGPGNTADGGDAIASVECIWGRRKAHMTIDPDLMNFNPEEQREVVTHELLHIHGYAVRALVTTALAPMLGSHAWEAFVPGLTKADEDATDALARAIAPFFPLWEG